MTDSKAATDTQQQIDDLARELHEGHERLAAMRRALPPEPVADYAFKGAGGAAVRLSEVFGKHDDLILVHNMGERCPYCTMWADGLEGLRQHIENRAAFVVVSSDTPEAQAAFAAKRGWGLRMLSAEGSTFTKDMGYEDEVDGQRWLRPGFSTFRRGPDGSITRIAHGPFGPGDEFHGAFHFFAHLDGGMGEWTAKLTYAVD